MRTGISRTGQRRADHKAATNRLYVAGHSGNCADEANAIATLAAQGIASDGYPFEWAGELHDDQRGIHNWTRDQPIYDRSGEQVFSAMEIERGGRAIVHDHRMEEGQTVATVGSFAEAVQTAFALLEAERDPRAGHRRR